MAPLARRSVEALLWIVGVGLAGLGALILWNGTQPAARDSGAIWFVFGAAVNGGLGLVLLRAAWRMHQPRSAHRP